MCRLLAWIGLREGQSYTTDTEADSERCFITGPKQNDLPFCRKMNMNRTRGLGFKQTQMISFKKTEKLLASCHFRTHSSTNSGAQLG